MINSSIAIPAYFNPLPRKEGDMFARFTINAAGISIHSLVKRETVGDTSLTKMLYISIHSLVKRETLFPFSFLISPFDFNPLPRKEGDTKLAGMVDIVANFNPLPRKEGDWGRRFIFCPRYNFNPLPRKEGDCKLLFSSLMSTLFQSTPS